MEPVGPKDPAPAPSAAWGVSNPRASAKPAARRRVRSTGLTLRQVVGEREGVVSVVVGEHRPLAADPLQLAGPAARHDRPGVGDAIRSHDSRVLEDEAPRLAAEGPADPVMPDVAAAALGLGDHQLGRALAIQIAAEGP